MEGIEEFVVVEFLATEEVSTIRASWLISENECYWPDRNPRSALVKGVGPDKLNWEKWGIRILDSCEQINAIERTVLQNKVDLSAILEILQNRNSHVGVITDQVTIPSEFETRFPMKELDDVLELEDSLSNNEEKKKELTNYLQSIGGMSMEDSIRRILVRLFTNEVARHFSWEGRGGKKRRLQDLSLVQLIGRVIRHKHQSTYDMKIFEKRMSEWFRQAGTRIYVKNKTPNIV